MTDAVGDARCLPSDQVVARYVGALHIDPITGQINGSAFERSPKDTDGVSFTRRGMLAEDTDQDRAAIRGVVGSRLRLGRTAVFAELQVGDALAALERFDQDVSFVEDPLPAEGAMLANPAHALLIDLPFKGDHVGSLKSEAAGDYLRQCVRDRFPAA